MYFTPFFVLSQKYPNSPAYLIYKRKSVLSPAYVIMITTFGLYFNRKSTYPFEIKVIDLNKQSLNNSGTVHYCLKKVIPSRKKILFEEYEISFKYSQKVLSV